MCHKKPKEYSNGRDRQQSQDTSRYKENHTYDRIERAHHPLSMLFDVEATVPQTHVDHYCE